MNYWSGNEKLRVRPTAFFLSGNKGYLILQISTLFKGIPNQFSTSYQSFKSKLHKQVPPQNTDEGKNFVQSQKFHTRMELLRCCILRRSEAFITKHCDKTYFKVVRVFIKKSCNFIMKPRY